MKKIIITFIVALAFITSINAQSLVYCSAGAFVNNDEFISNVEVGTIFNSSGNTNGGYEDYTNLSTDMLIGESYSISVTNGNPVYNSDQCGIWIDWNQDGDFNDPNESISVSGTPGTGPYTASIIPPADAVNGNTTMRIRITYTGILDPCGTTSYGEVEDYSINVIGCLANANFSYYDLGLEVDFLTDNYDSTFSVAWDFGDGTTLTNNNNPTHTYLTAGTYSVTLAVNDLLDSTCFDTVSYAITIDDCQTNSVFDYAVSNFTVDFAGYFVYDTINYLTTWDFGDGTTDTNLNIINHVYPGSGTFTITYTVEDLNYPNCTEMSTVTLELGNCNIEALLTWSAWGLDVNFTTFNSSGYDLIWDFGDTIITNNTVPSYTFDSTGTYNISLLVTEPGNPFCSDFIDTTIFVDACVSNANFTYSGTELEIDFETFYFWDTANYYIEWQFGDGSSSVAYNVNSPNHIYLSSGQYNVTCIIQDLIDSDCADTLVQTITVYPPCIVDADFTWIDYGNWIYDFMTVSSFNSDYIFDWNFGDGNSSNLGDSVHHVYSSAGTYSVSLTVYQTTNPNCYEIATYSLIVPECITDGEFTIEATYLSVDFSAVNIFDLALYDVSWDFGDGSPVVEDVFDVNHEYAGTGSYSVTLTVSNILNPNCVDVYNSTVTVSECVANAMFTEIANNYEYDFTTTSSTGDYSIEWDLGDGTIINDVSYVNHTYDTVGTYTVSLTITDLLEPTCTDTYSKDITVNIDGIDDNLISQDKFMIYPNPVTENVNLEISLSENSKFVVNILNAIGQSVKKEYFDKTYGQHKLSIDVSNLPSGIYMLKVEFDSNNTKTLKFIK